jgi:hypothetical protein
MHRGIVQHVRPTEGLNDHRASSSALEAVDGRALQLVGAVAVGDLLDNDL